MSIHITFVSRRARTSLGAYANNTEEFAASTAAAAAAESVKGDRQVRLLEIVDVLESALYLFEKVALALTHFAASLTDDEVVYGPFEYKMIAPTFPGNTQLLNNAECFQHLKVSVDA